MASKRGRPPKRADEGLQPITVLIPPSLKAALERQAKAENRPFSEIVRRRLTAEDERPYSIARALGDLCEMYVEFVERVVPAPDELLGMVKYGIPVAVTSLGAKELDKQSRELADSAGAALAASIAMARPVQHPPNVDSRSIRIAANHLKIQNVLRNAGLAKVRK